MKSELKFKILLGFLCISLLLSGVSNKIIIESDISSGNISVESNDINSKDSPTVSNSLYSFPWTKDGEVICNDTTRMDIHPKICSDGDGGAFIVWRNDSGGNDGIAAQYINSDGIPQWGKIGNEIRGISIYTHTSSIGEYKICSDKKGGAIIAWSQSDAAIWNLYAQRINLDGDLLWGTGNGAVVCNEEPSSQYDLVMCNDGDGGAIIAWEDWRSANADIYAQHINSTGDALWGEGNDKNGTVVCNYGDSELQDYYSYIQNAICSDGMGGAIIAWEDDRKGNDDIYAQHIDLNGNIFWGENGDLNGTYICNASGGQYGPVVCMDGENGAFIAWEDTRAGSFVHYDIYAQHVTNNGITEWGDGSYWGGISDRNGTVICNERGEYNHQKAPKIVSDGAKGAIIAWSDNRSGKYAPINPYISGNFDIYAQRINLNGDTLWVDNGTAATQDDILDNGFQLCCDGAKGAIISWYNATSNDMDIMVNRIDKNGNVLWGENGTDVSNPPGNVNQRYVDYNFYEEQYMYQICCDGKGGAIMTWTDDRGDDIYAAKVLFPLPSAPGGGALLAGDDDDDDDDEDTGVVVVVVVIIVIASMAGGLVVIYVLIQKGIIDTSKLKSKLKRE